MTSEEVEAEFEVWVADPVPGMFPLPPGPRPILYVLDADLFFGTAVEMSRLMHQLYGELPPLRVVGIAYGVDDPALQAELRARDFTPTADSGFDEMRRSMPGREPSLPEGRRLGGADRFLRCLEREVRPLVASRYDVLEGGETLFGASLGGLFALYALFRSPGLFDATIAVSPAIWWDDRLLLELEASMAEGRDDLPVRLVLAVGGLEEDPRIPMLAPFRMISNVRELAERMAEREYPSLRLDAHVLEGESHTSVVPAALTRGLRAMYGRPPPSPAATP